MWRDPIVEEIRRYREEYAARFNFDIHAIVRDLMERQENSGRTYVSSRPKRVEKGTGFVKQEDDHSTPNDDDARTEYDTSELKGGGRGKYFAPYRTGRTLAVLAPVVRAAFPTDDAVNEALRSLMGSQNQSSGPR